MKKYDKFCIQSIELTEKHEYLNARKEKKLLKLHLVVANGMHM